MSCWEDDRQKHDFRFGVPERVDKNQLVNPEDTVIITARPAEDDADDQDLCDNIPVVERFPTTVPADYVYVYTPQPDNEES